MRCDNGNWLLIYFINLDILEIAPELEKIPVPDPPCLSCPEEFRTNLEQMIRVGQIYAELQIIPVKSPPLKYFSPAVDFLEGMQEVMMEMMY